jgi:Flp pilus assembly protein TadG
VETALTLPVLLLLALGVVDLGRAFYYREAVVNATRQAARLSVNRISQSTANSACASSGGSAVTLTTSIPASGSSPLNGIADQIALESSSNGLPSGSAVAGGSLSITWHCSGGLAVTNATNGGITDPSDSRSDAVSATITFQLPLVTPFTYLFNGSFLNLKQSEIGRAEY